MWNPGSDPGTEKGHYWKNERKSNKVCSLVNSIELMFISDLVIVLWLCKMLTIVSGSYFKIKFFLKISGCIFMELTIGQFAKVFFAFSVYHSLLF